MTTPTTPSYSDDETSGGIYRDLLPEDPPDVGYVGFQNSAHAMALGINVEWFPRGPDATIPMTDEEEQRVAWKLLCSLKDMSIAWESAEDADRKCLTPGEAMYYGEATLQHCVWQLLFRSKCIHIYGYKASIYDQDTLDAIRQTEDWTFQQRIDWICAILRTSKFDAVGILRYQNMLHILCAPHMMYRGTPADWAAIDHDTPVHPIANNHGIPVHLAANNHGTSVVSAANNDGNLVNSAANSHGTSVDSVANNDNILVDSAANDHGATSLKRKADTELQAPDNKRQKLEHTSSIDDPEMNNNTGEEASLVLLILLLLHVSLQLLTVD